MATKTNTERLTQPLKWHGGKHYLAKAIIELIPPHTHYVEPYFGGGSVFLQKPLNLIEGHSEVVNDVYGELMNFWDVLRDETTYERFRRQVELTPFSKDHWKAAAESTATDPVDRAVDFFVRYRQSRQGLGKDFATMSRSRTRRGMNEQVSSWLSAIDGLDAVHARLRRVVITNEDAVAVIRREDHQQSFFYCDPPYLLETRTAKNAYENELNDESHRELLEVLGGLKGTFILSGYPAPLYLEAEQRFGWNRIDIQIDNKASNSKSKPIKTECLWFNFSAEPQGSLLL